MKNYIIAFILLCLVIAGGWYIASHSKSAPVDVGNTEPVSVVTYNCNSAKTIEASFYEGESTAAQGSQPPVPGGSVVVKLSDGRSMTLAQTVSADGARYANSDESFVFWSKGNGALVLENNTEKSFIGCVRVATQAEEDTAFPQIYSNTGGQFSLRLPEGYTKDESYKYQLSPSKTIFGVKFTIPTASATGTNLSSDSYISVESLPQISSCTASLFLDGTHAAVENTENGVTYSMASSTGAGAGNRYEETVYSFPGTNPCVAIRYFIHYGVFQNYPEGSIKEFDRQALLAEFDQIRGTLVINQ